jgi:hypothetical protein
MELSKNSITNFGEFQQSQLILDLGRASQSRPPRAGNQSPLARNTDPVSSNLAIDAITRCGRRANQKRQLLIVDPVWTPRRELLRSLPKIFRAAVDAGGLLLRALLAIGLGGHARCNITLDAIIVQQEGRN